MSTANSQSQHPPHKESVKETLISILIAFVLAFVFRSFVVEAFIIPTGSMAPTLLGAHMRFGNPETGADWTVGPWNYGGRPVEPLSTQGTASPIVVHDPVSGEAITRKDVPLRSGDRILVQKYLFGIREPRRFDVVVFKNPSDPTQNYIKRLLGLPNEELALVDGDLFTRPVAPGTPEPAAEQGTTSAARWLADGWTIARKDTRVMKAVWQEVFDAAKTPLSFGPSSSFKFPFVGASEAKDAWTISDNVTLPRGAVRSNTPKKATLGWNNQQRLYSTQAMGGVDFDRTIVDRYAYNDLTPQQVATMSFFPVSDVRVRAGVRPDQDGLSYRVILQARGHVFVGEIAGGKATITMRPQDAAADAPAKVLGSGEAKLAGGVTTNVEFWHSDQSLKLFIGGRLIAEGTYDWTPAQRIQFATGRSLESLMERQQKFGNVLADPSIYRAAQLRLELEGSPATIYGLAVDRDLHYQPAKFPGIGDFADLPANATNPNSTVRLGPDQFFCCGDNSPQSMDGRLWNRPDPWIEDLMKQRGMTNSVGVVSRDLMLGKAFFVYFPSLLQGGPAPVPDVGRMRFIQ